MGRFHLPWRGAAWAVVLICALAGCSKSKPPDQLVMGQAFPAMSLQGIDGKQIPLAAFRGKLVVLNVWATWCPPCRKELPSLQRLSRSLDGKRFVIVGLSLDQDNVAVREYLHDRGVTYVNFLDRDLDIAKNVLGMKAYPDTFFIGPDGTLLGRVVGAIDWDNSRMLQALEAAYRGDSNSLRNLPRGVYGSS
jgi:thiol-disulfide isomerase/thioredoxin